MDEFTLAATLWSTVGAIGDARPPALSDQGQLVMAALMGTRMNVVRLDATARFARGYVRHTWGFDGAYHLVDITPHPAYSEPMLADYLDALRCDRATSGNIEHAIRDALRGYPYPVDLPARCQPAPAPPMTVTLAGPAAVKAGDDVPLRLTITRPTPGRAPLEVSFALPPGVQLRGKAREVIADGSAVVTRDLHLNVTRVPKRDAIVTVAARASSWGVTARAAYRFGRPAPRTALARDALVDGAGRVVARPVRAR